MNELTPLPQLDEVTTQDAFTELVRIINEDSFNHRVFSVFFDGVFFRGGNGSRFRTVHEEVFAVMFPEMKEQMAFGTGSNGLKKYGAKRFVADFVDFENNRVFEIDGASHKRIKTRISDLQKEIFFIEKQGFETVRLSNQKVEEMMLSILGKSKVAGNLSSVFCEFRSRIYSRRKRAVIAV